MLKLNFILVTLLLSSNVYGMSCKEAVSKTPSANTIDITNDVNSFEMATSLFEYAMFSHSLSYQVVKRDEHLFEARNRALSLKSYLVTLGNGSQVLFQVKFILRKETGNYFYSFVLADLDSGLDIFSDKYSIVSTMNPEEALPPEDSFDSDMIAGFRVGSAIFQILDEHNENYIDGMPRSIEAIFEDFSGKEIETLEFQQAVMMFMAQISKLRPEF